VADCLAASFPSQVRWVVWFQRRGSGDAVERGVGLTVAALEAAVAGPALRASTGLTPQRAAKDTRADDGEDGDRRDSGPPGVDAPVPLRSGPGR